MSRSDALGHLSRQSGDPDKKWLTNERVKAAIGAVYDDIEGQFHPVMEVLQDGRVRVDSGPPMRVVGGEPFLGDNVYVIPGDERVAVAGSSRRFTPQYEVGISSGYGILERPPQERKRELAMYAEVGASWVRIDFDWSWIERVQGTYDWSLADAVVADVESFGLKCMGLLAYSPEWATTVPGENHAPPQNLSHFAAFCAAAAARYPHVTWELWNEPNIHFWQPLPDPAAYTNLVKAAYPAIKSANPSATVLAGALSPAVDEVDGTGIAPATFTQQCYTNGIKGYFDGWSVHPYCYPAYPSDEQTKAWNTFQRLPLIRDVMVANTDTAKKMWLTEFGAPTGTHPTAVSEREQASQLVDGLVLRLMWGDWLEGPLFIYSGRDAGDDPADREQNFGLVRNNWTPKESFRALSNALHYGVTVPAGDGTPQMLKVGGAVETERYVQFQTDGTARWAVGANPDEELTPGAGSNFVVARYDDAGAFIDNPIDISRETGGVSMSRLWLRGGPIDNVAEINVADTARPIVAGEVGAEALESLLLGLDALGLIDDESTPASGGGGGGGITGPIVTIDGLATEDKLILIKSGGVTRWVYGVNPDLSGAVWALRRHDAAGVYQDDPISVGAETGDVTLSHLKVQSRDNTRIALDVRAATMTPASSLFRVALLDGTPYFTVAWDGTVSANWGSGRFAANKMGCTLFVREGASAGNTIIAGYTSTANADADTAVFRVMGSGAVQIGPAVNGTDAIQKDQLKTLVAGATDFAAFKAAVAAW